MALIRKIATGTEGGAFVKFAGLKSRALVFLSPLLLITACTTQNALDGGIGVPQASFAATAPSASLATAAEDEGPEMVAAQAEPAADAGKPETGQAVATQAGDAGKQEVQQAKATSQGEDSSIETIAPAYAKADAAGGESGKKLVQVASLYPKAPKLPDDADPGPGRPMTFSEQLGLSGKARPLRFSSRDHECMARAMFFESNRSSRDGMIAVGSVVMNRLDSGKWGDSVCGVVGAPRQFAPGVMTRRLDSRALPDVMEAAEAVLKGERHPRIYKDVMFFHTAGHRFRYNNMHYVAVAGGNSFYEKRRRMRGQANTPQHVVMAQAGGSRAERLTGPVRTAFAAPVKATRSLWSREERSSAPKTVKIRRQEKPAAPVEAPRPAEAAPQPSPPANGGYMKAASGGFVTVAGNKGGRVARRPSPAGD